MHPAQSWWLINTRVEQKGRLSLPIYRPGNWPLRRRDLIRSPSFVSGGTKTQTLAPRNPRTVWVQGGNEMNYRLVPEPVFLPPPRAHPLGHIPTLSQRTEWCLLLRQGCHLQLAQGPPSRSLSLMLTGPWSVFTRITAGLGNSPQSMLRFLTT